LLARIALGEQQQSMTPREFAKRRRRARQQFTMTIDQALADPLNLRAQIPMMAWMRKLYRPLDAAPANTGSTAVSVALDYPQFVTPHGCANRAIVEHPPRGPMFLKRGLGFQKMDVRIPQRIVGVEIRFNAPSERFAIIAIERSGPILRRPQLTRSHAIASHGRSD